MDTTLNTDIPETDADGDDVIRISEILGQDQKPLEKGSLSIRMRVGNSL